MNQPFFIKFPSIYLDAVLMKFGLLILTFFFFLNFNLCYTQIPTTTAFLQDHLQTIDSLFAPTPTAANFKPALIDKIEIRTNADNFEPEERDYRIRFSPTTQKIRKAEKNLFQSYQAIAQLEKNSLKEDYIEDLYQEILTGLELTKALTFKENLLANLEDQKKVIQKLMMQSTSPPKEWLNIQQDISDLQIELYQIKTEKQKLNFTVEVDNFLSIDTLLSQIKQKTAVDIAAPIFFRETQLETQLIEQEIALEKAEQKQWFEFLQFQMDNSKKDLIQQKIDISASFILPSAPRRNLKIAELQIEKEMLQAKAFDKQQQVQTEQAAIQEQIQSLYKTLVFTQQVMQKNQEQTQTLLNKSQQNEIANPLILLQVQEQQWKNKLNILDLEIKIYEEYLEWLIITGQLFQSPRKVFLLKE